MNEPLQRRHVISFDFVPGKGLVVGRECDMVELEWLTTRQAARVLGLSERRTFDVLFERLRRGVTAKRTGPTRGGPWRWRADAVEQLAAARGREVRHE